MTMLSLAKGLRLMHLIKLSNQKQTPTGHFNVFSGCLRIAYAKYDLEYKRLETTYTKKRYWPGTLLSVEVQANCKSYIHCMNIIYLSYPTNCIAQR